MKRVVLAEKPSVAKDLARVLGAHKKEKSFYEGKDVIVTWALGHLMTLKMPEDVRKEWATWEMETLPMLPKKIGIKPLPRSGGQLKAIEKLINRSDVQEIVIATDAGREGELVARWILEYARCRKPLKRLWISSQTDKAIKDGFKQLKDGRQYDNLYYSALARAQADWLVGLNVTRALTVKYQDSLSAGRVQTPTLALVREQEKKVEKFVPQSFYTITAHCHKLTAKLAKQFSSKEEAQQMVDVLQHQKGVVRQITEKEQKEWASLPYDLTEIQKEANHRYQFSAKKTLSLVQSLYETHKIVTYPRTDSRYLTQDMKNTMKDRLQAIVEVESDAKKHIQSGAKVTQGAVFNDNKVTDHHALIPTEQRPLLHKLTQDEMKIYRMIVKRFIGLFEQPYHYAKQTVHVVLHDQTFVFKQVRVIDPGFKKEGSPTFVDCFTQDGTVSLTVSMQQEWTTPPNVLNEGALLGAMEKYQLGTPATRAEIIEKLIQSQMLDRVGVVLKVTPKGKQLLTLVNPALVTPDLTQKWETDLESIAKGAGSAQTFIQQIEQDVRTLVGEIKQSTQTYQDFSITQKKCPDCGDVLKEKKTRDGVWYVCASQACRYRRRKDAKVTNHRCAQCHKKMVLIEGKNGAYFKCVTCSVTEKVVSKSEKKKKITKHEEKRLMQKINQQQEVVESPFAMLKTMIED